MVTTLVKHLCATVDLTRQDFLGSTFDFFPRNKNNCMIIESVGNYLILSIFFFIKVQKVLLKMLQGAITSKQVGLK